MIVRVCACGLVAALAATGAHAARGQPLIARGVQPALIHAGYPARTQCGEVAEPPTPLSTHGRIASEQTIPACWVVVERDGFSVHVTPRSDAAAATLASQKIRNRWATRSRVTAVGYVVLTGYRMTSRDWKRISRVVASVVIGAHRH
jgi:hypothetical protein